MFDSFWSLSTVNIWRDLVQRSSTHITLCHNHHNPVISLCSNENIPVLHHLWLPLLNIPVHFLLQSGAVHARDSRFLCFFFCCFLVAMSRLVLYNSPFGIVEKIIWCNFIFISNLKRTNCHNPSPSPSKSESKSKVQVKSPSLKSKL